MSIYFKELSSKHIIQLVTTSKASNQKDYSPHVLLDILYRYVEIT